MLGLSYINVQNKSVLTAFLLKHYELQTLSLSASHLTNINDDFKAYIFGLISTKVMLSSTQSVKYFSIILIIL